MANQGQMKRTYRSNADWRIINGYYGLLGTLFLLFHMTSPDGLPTLFVAAYPLCPLGVWWFVRAQWYEINSTQLVMRTRVLPGVSIPLRIDLANIVEVVPSKKWMDRLFGGTCWFSRDRIRISHRRKWREKSYLCFAVVAPEHPDGFLRDLAECVPELKRDGDGLVRETESHATSHPTT